MSGADEAWLGERLVQRKDMSITMLPMDKLLPYARNSRTHSQAQVAQIAASMREFGWTNPVLVDEHHMIIAGHGRVMAARLLNLVEDIPCIVLAGMSKTQKQALVLADNKLAMNAAWDDDLLVQELGELSESGFSLETIGFSAAEIDAMLHGVGPMLEGEDEGPTEPPVIPVSVLGDVWLLGNHRLVCGDSTDPLVVDKALNSAKPHLMVTDPPYGVNYDPGWRNGLDSVKRSLGKVDNDNRSDWREAWALFPGDVAYVWHSGTMAHTVAEGLIEAKFQIRSQIIWVKPHFAISRGHYHPQHEPCWYAVRGTGHWSGDRKQSTVWQITNNTFQGGKIDPENAKTGHSTQKPVECMKRPIENNSAPGDAVYEPFSGSGTTIVAGEQTGRAVHAIELSPAYVDVAAKRWQVLTGEKAKLEGDGRTFDELSLSREKK